MLELVNAMIEYKNTKFASRRANRATRFDANQDHLKDRIAVRKSTKLEYRCITTHACAPSRTWMRK